MSMLDVISCRIVLMKIEKKSECTGLTRSYIRNRHQMCDDDACAFFAFEAAHGRGWTFLLKSTKIFNKIIKNFIAL